MLLWGLRVIKPTLREPIFQILTLQNDDYSLAFWQSSFFSSTLQVHCPYVVAFIEQILQSETIVKLSISPEGTSALSTAWILLWQEIDGVWQTGGKYFAYRASHITEWIATLHIFTQHAC